MDAKEERMNHNLKKLFFGLLIMFMLLVSIFGAFAEESGSAKLQIKIYNDSFKVTDKNGNANTWDCTTKDEMTLYYPANCPVASCHCNVTCPKDIVNLNATCNKECPSIPKQNITCNPQVECAECPKPDHSAFWVGFIFLLIIIGGLVFVIFKVSNENQILKGNKHIPSSQPNAEIRKKDVSPNESYSDFEELK